MSEPEQAMDVRLKTELKNATESLLETCEIAKIYGDEEQQSETYLKIVQEIIAIKENAIKDHEILEMIRNCSSLAEVDNISKNVSGNKAAYMRQALKNNEYKELAKKIKGIFESSAVRNEERHEDEDLVMESNINLIDPLTRQQIKNPVRNKHCGHIYDADTIKNAMEINQNLKCPVAGCGRRQPLCASDLVIAHDLRKHIAEMNIE